MNVKYKLFETELYESMCDLDVDQLFDLCQQHQDKVKSTTLSNRGGYQGHYFSDPVFYAAVMKHLPAVPDRPLPRIDLQAWVNINGHGHWNALHNHLDEGCLISGILYVRCPKDSGDLYIYDPRYLGNVGPYYRYYANDQSNGGGYIQITPRENLLLFFPPSLMHMVGPNLSQELRCSIAFNVLAEPGQNLNNPTS